MTQTPEHILKVCYGYDSFRPMQREIIQSMLDCQDSLVLMPTGGGKSICFQIPALMLPGTAVVVSPLISLMKDQVEALRSNGISAEALNSNNDDCVNAAIKRRCETGEIKLLYTSPERLLADLEWLYDNVEVSFFAIDEAHCISQWGHDFRPEYTRLSVLRRRFPECPVMALTATADKLTKTDIVDRLELRGGNMFISSFDRPNLSLDVRRGYTASDKMRLIRSIISRHPGDSGIIYCMSRKTTESVAYKLQSAGVTAGVYHAGLSADQRNRVQEDFINDRIDVVVATIAFGMGIDKSNVRYVIHYNLPRSIESFYQEIGRGGRDSLPAETVLFYNLQDLITLISFADDSGQQEINLEKLRRMQEYAEAQVCRRRILLNYFGETSDRDCCNCDVCRTPPVRFDGTVLVQKALSAIRRTDEKIGFRLTVEILRGACTTEIIERGYDRIKTYGAGRDVSYRDWNDYLLQMLQMGFIEIAYDEDRHLKVTSLGEEVLFGRRRVELAVISHDYTRDRSQLRQGKKSTANRSAGTVSAGILFADLNADTEDHILFERLRTLRREIADESRVPAFVVMSDKTLHALAASKPRSVEAFGDSYGIGEHKRDAYGPRFVSLINDYLDETGNKS